MQYLEKIHKNCLLGLALFSFWSGLVYFLYRLDLPAIGAALLLTIISYIIIQRFTPKNNTEEVKKSNEGATTWAWGAVYLFFLAGSLWLALSARVTTSIISPWENISACFWPFYFLGVLTLFLFFRHNPGRQSHVWLLVVHYLFSFSIIIIIYSIGYGFDVFVHEATAELIADKGSVEPKNLYYLGQYGLLIGANKLFWLPLALTNKILVPLLAGVSLPLALAGVGWRLGRKNFLPLLGLAIFPFSVFTFSVPQNLGFLFLFLIIIYGLTATVKHDFIFLSALAAATMTVHPVAGIPAVIFVLWLIGNKYLSEKLYKFFSTGLFVSAVMSLPLAFYLINHQTAGNINFSFAAVINNAANLMPIMPWRENIYLNFSYLIEFNKYIYIFLPTAVGWYLSRGEKTYRPYFFMSIALSAGYLLSLSLPYEFLIDYERNNYANRLLIMAGLFSLPFVWLVLENIFKKIINQKKHITAAWFIFFSILITTSLYLSYPRFDNYFNSHGYSTSQVDIEAVNWINKQADGDYVVLANQQVSAGALHEFGFKKYYTPSINGAKGVEPVFYYPIPTGGPLYRYYLDMVYKKPSRETMRAAMDLAGVNESYFVLNKYWWAFPKLLEEAKYSADSYQEFGANEVWVFKYKK